jgi:hypothetical protein
MSIFVWQVPKNTDQIYKVMDYTEQVHKNGGPHWSSVINNNFLCKYFCSSTQTHVYQFL